MTIEYEYKLTLPEHSHAVADKYKSIPSVFAICTINANKFNDEKAVTHSGPTYVTIRSGKYDSSTTYDHGRDLLRMYSDATFKAYVHASDKPKYVLIIRTDGGPIFT